MDMGTTVDYLSIMSEIMNEIPMDKVLGDAVQRLPIYHRVLSVANAKEFAGKWQKGTMQTTFNRNAGPREERDDVIVPLSDGYTNLTFTIKQLMSSIGWTQEEAEDAITEGGSAVLNLVNRKMQFAPQTMQRLLDYAYLTDGTGRLARVASITETSAGVYGTITVDNTKEDFGWDGLTWLENGMLVDIYTVADVTPLGAGSAWTVKATKCRVSSVDKSGLTFVISIVTDEPSGNGSSGTAVTDSVLGTGGTVPADSDYIFVHNSVNLTSAVKFYSWNMPYGLMTIVDDGSSAGSEFTESTGDINGCWCGSSIYGLTRTSYPQLKCLMRRAAGTGYWGTSGTAGTEKTATIDDIQESISMIDNEGDGGGKCSVLFMNGGTRRWLSRTGAAEQNLFTPSQSGKVTPGLFTTAMRTDSGGLVDIVTVNRLPDGVIVGGDESDLIRFTRVPLGWHMLDGKKIFTPPGARNLTKESWMRQRENLVGLSWNWFCMKDIDISS